MILTDGQYNELLVKTLSPIVEDVWEGIYTGDDLDEYITFYYTSSPTMFCNNRPTVLLRYTTVVLWVRNGEDTFSDREAIRKALAGLGGSVPRVSIATENFWQQYIFTFTHGCGYPEEADDGTGDHDL